MITRDEYNKALDVVEAYHKQLFTNNVGILRDLEKTHLRDWEPYKHCSIRLKKVLHGAFYNWKFAKNIEDIDISELKKCRGVGKKTLDEFKELRGH